MKKIICSFFILMLVNTKPKAQSSIAEQLASKIAQKMKDSLSLTGIQKQQLYLINMGIANRKTIVRQQYISSDSLILKIQRVENKRDSLYRPVLSEYQYQLYRQKKRNLVNNN